MSTDRPLKETSYGGVVVRGDEVLVITPIGKRRVTGLPKGGPNPGERPEQTAAREVREETGVTATVREPLGDVHYWYRRGGRRVYKTVHFYLMEAVGGDTSLHDHEYDEAAWFPIEEAGRRLSFANERLVVTKAAAELAEVGDTSAAS